MKPRFSERIFIRTCWIRDSPTQRRNTSVCSTRGELCNLLLNFLWFWSERVCLETFRYWPCFQRSCLGWDFYEDIIILSKYMKCLPAFSSTDRQQVPCELTPVPQIAFGFLFNVKWRVVALLFLQTELFATTVATKSMMTEAKCSPFLFLFTRLSFSRHRKSLDFQICLIDSFSSPQTSTSH